MERANLRYVNPKHDITRRSPRNSTRSAKKPKIPIREAMRASGKAFRLGRLAVRVGGEVVGDAGIEITGLGALGSAAPGQISHLSHAAYRDKLAATGASAVILRRDQVAACPTNALVVANPYHAFAKISHLWDEPIPLNPGIHPSAWVDSGAVVHATARIGPGVVIGAGTRVGARARLYANVAVGRTAGLTRTFA